jgi:hypothetical protein
MQLYRICPMSEPVLGVGMGNLFARISARRQDAAEAVVATGAGEQA